MANTILTPTMVTREAARILHQKLNFIGRCNRQYDDSFAKSGARIGDTLKVRLPNEYTIRSGINMAAQNLAETSVDLTVATVKGVDMSFTSQELALSLDDFSERIVQPAMTVLAANIEADALSMYKSVYNLYDGDTLGFSFTSVTNGRQVLTDNLAPTSPRTLTMNTTHATKFMIDTKSLLHESEAISAQYREGKMGTGASGGASGPASTVPPPVPDCPAAPPAAPAAPPPPEPDGPPPVPAVPPPTTPPTPPPPTLPVILAPPASTPPPEKTPPPSPPTPAPPACRPPPRATPDCAGRESATP